MVKKPWGIDVLDAASVEISRRKLLSTTDRPLVDSPPVPENPLIPDPWTLTL